MFNNNTHHRNAIPNNRMTFYNVHCQNILAITSVGEDELEDGISAEDRSTVGTQQIFTNKDL